MSLAEAVVFVDLVQTRRCVAARLHKITAEAVVADLHGLELDLRVTLARGASA